MKDGVVIKLLLHTSGWITPIVHYREFNDTVMGFSATSALWELSTLMLRMCGCVIN